MTAVQPPPPASRGFPGPPLDYVHLGAFSGSAISLRDAVCARTSPRVFDLLTLARRPALLPGRLAALLEARRAGPGVPWSKTAAWSRTLERAYLRRARPRPRALLLVQTVAAFGRPAELGIPYVVYTDRVGREGAVTGGHFASRFSPGWLRAEEHLLREAQRVYTMGPSTRDVLVGEYGLQAERVRVAPAGPNIPIGPMRPESEPVRCRRLLFVGTQWELKGGPELLCAFAAARRRHPELELVVAGAEPPPPLPEGVRCAGRVPHGAMTDLYLSADAVVVPTHVEAFGIALAEGLMTGLPCIASTIGNQGWIAGDAGILVPPGDVDALAGAIDELVERYDDLRSRAAARGRVLREEFSWDRVADTILADLAVPTWPT